MNQSILAFFTRILMTVVIVLAAPQAARAFDLSTYAENSVLASGRWVKISVSETGMHLITTADLRRWGFNDPAKVRVYGYGGRRIADQLSLANYTDDLPEVQSAVTSRGVCFYAVGPEGWHTFTTNGIRRFEHVANPYTTRGYYYLTESDEPLREIPVEGPAYNPASPATSFTESTWHERDLVSLVQSGHTLFGEDFRFTPSQRFNFDLTDRVEGTDVFMMTRFFCDSPSAQTTLSFTANNTELIANSSDRIPATPSGDYFDGDSCSAIHTFPLSGSKLTLGITHNTTRTITAAYLDKIEINYTRRLSLGAKALIFRLDTNAARLDGAGEGTRIWDVTDHLRIFTPAITAGAGSLSFSTPYNGLRTYAAWNDQSAMPSPEYVVTVDNQNLHSIRQADMVIFTTAALRTQAERIAELHRNEADSLTVVVVEAGEVYNEFSSGSADVNSFRRMLKMVYDRGNAEGRPLRYCLMMGRAIADHRRLTTAWANTQAESLPVWQTDQSINTNYTYSSDDILAMLDDNSGARKATQKLNIAVGRIPAATADEARSYVDKLYAYSTAAPHGEWANRVLLIADDQDSGTHMLQTETIWNNMQSTPVDGSNIFYNKVYIDAYEMIGNNMPEARSRMFRLLNEGTMWWNYVGHGNINSWAHEFQLTSSDIDDLFIKNLPVMYAATCSFSQWDGSERSGSETLLFKDNGGVIAAFSATRPVYIPQNGNLSSSMSQAMLRRRADGRFRTIGEIIQDAKNYTFTASASRFSDENRLRYVLMGDPAMHLALPDHRVVLDRINGVNVDDEDIQPIIAARSTVTLEGHVESHDGTILDNFNGSLHLTMYDAERTTTSRGRSTAANPGQEINFDEQGDRLFTGRDSIHSGRFTVKVVMPSDITQNFRPAALNMYASSADGQRAAGCNRDFYVYGYDEESPADDVAPVIEYAYLNHSSFSSGDRVNESPLLLAKVSDNIGINLSSAGVGHQMSVTLDGSKMYNDVSLYYTPADDGSPSGTIIYPIEGLAPGNHTLQFRVWDTANNSAISKIDFFVEEGAAPKIFDIYTDTNPATTEANFFISHNRPDASLTVTIEVFNLMGRKEWSKTVTSRSDMFVTSPVTWDLCDAAGRRVPRGIYLYRATVSSPDGPTSTSMSKRIAVTGR